MIPFRVCIFGGAGGTLTIPNSLADVDGSATSCVIQGNVTFIATNMYSGTTTISAGTLQLGDGSTTASFGAGDVTDNSSLVFDCVDDTAIGNAISGSGSLTPEGPDTLSLTGTNSYSGFTMISDGTLRIGAGTTGSLGTGVVVDNWSLVFDCGPAVTIADPIEGTGSLTQEGSDTLTLTGPNSYSGTTTISAGTLEIDAGGTIGSLGTGDVTDDAALVFNRSDNVTVNNSISGTGSLTQAGSGTLTLTGANSYGATTVSAGTLQVGDGNTGSLGAGDVTDAAALVFDYPTGSSPITTGNTIGGAGSLTQAGSNTLILTGANNFAGTITVSEALLTGALASTISATGDPAADTGATYTLSLSSSGASPLTGWNITSSDGGTWLLVPGDASATHTFAGQGTYTITATATDASGERGTARAAVNVDVTPPVFAINTSAVPVEQGDFVNWQTHVFVDCGDNTHPNYQLQMPALELDRARDICDLGRPAAGRGD